MPASIRRPLITTSCRSLLKPKANAKNAAFTGEKAQSCRRYRSAYISPWGKMSKRPKPLVLTVLDGWGYRAETKGNAIALARKPNYDRLLKEFPNTLIHTSGPS